MNGQFPTAEKKKIIIKVPKIQFLFFIDPLMSTSIESEFNLLMSMKFLKNNLFGIRKEPFFFPFLLCPGCINMGVMLNMNSGFSLYPVPSHFTNLQHFFSQIINFSSISRVWRSTVKLFFLSYLIFRTRFLT